MGIPSADKGTTRRRRPRARVGFLRGCADRRLGPCLQRGRAGIDQEAESALRSDGGEQRAIRSRAEKRAWRHTRRGVRGAATSASPRAAGPLHPLAVHPRCSRRAGRVRLRGCRAGVLTRTGLHVPANRRAPPAARRRTADPHGPCRAGREGTARARARIRRRARRDRHGSVRRGATYVPQRRAIAPRETVLPASARGVRCPTGGRKTGVWRRPDRCCVGRAERDDPRSDRRPAEGLRLR